MRTFFQKLTTPVIYLAFISVASSCSAVNSKPLENIENTGVITHGDIDEASGLAASQRQEKLLWTLNDSGNRPVLFAVTTKGEPAGTLKIAGIKNHDWEDLASFHYQGKPYLLIADTGDNSAKRKTSFLHFIEEPEPEMLSPDATLSVKPTWTIEFSYEGGPRDCESVAVDIKNEKILLLSKRDHPPALYELPLGNTDHQIMLAKKTGDIKPLPEPELKEIRALKNFYYAKQPTAVDISPDGLSLVVLTYMNAYLYQNNAGENWASTLSTSPKEIELPYLSQAESICFDQDGKNIYVSSEGLPAPLLKIDLTILNN